MITFTYKTDFSLPSESLHTEWISQVIQEENCDVGDFEFVFCNDSYLHIINLEYLNHDTLTDIITFDYRVGDLIIGEIFISIDRVRENASEFNVSFDDELHRVMVHGILHILGYNDLNHEQELAMRSKEDWALSLRDFLI